MSPLSPGSKLGRYEIAAILGQGAMGVVYLAHDPEIDRPVALKTVRPEALRGESAPEVEARFLKEAKLAGRLQHPNVVTVYDVGRDRGDFFIAMEYVDGQPLTRYLASADALPLNAKIGVIRQTAEALDHAHERGVVHRDIKPGNILISKDGRVKVTDFGIARFTSATTSDLTRTGTMIGSPAYMSPEQIRGEKLDGRSDLFSLGVVLYELLTGTRPFPGESITTLVYQILHTEPRDPREIRADLPAASREVMAVLLAKQPEKRPENAKAFLRELKRIEKFQRESEMTRRAIAVAAAPDPRPAAAPTLPPRTDVATPPAAPPPPPTIVATRGPSRGSRAVVLVGLAALAALLLAVYALWKAPVPNGPETAALAPTAAPAVTLAPATPAPTAEPAAVEPTPLTLPTPGPAAAADVVVGAPRVAGAPAARPTVLVKPTAPPREDEKVAVVASAEPPPPPPPPPPAAADDRAARIDATYATRRAVRFTSSPEQARLYVDGRYVGIADDWDNRGGGREYEFDKPGSHIVRMELPGYRPKRFEIDVGSDGRDSVSIDEELERNQKLPYEKLPAPSDRTTGEVEFNVTPPEAVITEGDKTLGPASSFGPGSPLKLSPGTVHDLMLTAPGYRPMLVRILVASNAGRDRAKISEKLKKE
jgi:predicted Ser/Thr protein kinase